MIGRDLKGRFVKGNKPYWTGKHRDKITRDKISKTLEGNIPWNKNLKGTHFSPETEFNGELKHWLGKAFSEKHIKNLSEAHKGNYPSEETRRKMSESQKGRKMGEENPSWRGGISKQGYPFNFNKELKELIRQRDGYQCQLCGMPEIENIKKLSIHHIDYVKKNCSPDNLVSLCEKCNTKVNSNRDYWTEYFQDKIDELDL